MQSQGLLQPVWQGVSQTYYLTVINVGKCYIILPTLEYLYDLFSNT